MTASKDIFVWQSVPERVAQLLPAAAKIRAAHEKAALAADILPVTLATWNPDINGLTIYTQTPLSKKAYSVYENSVYDGDINFAGISGAQPDWDEEILIKRGSFALPGVKHVWGLGNKALLGPTPLSNGIVSALLLGGLGYGSGALAEQLFPERYMRRGRLRRTLGLVGALGGAGIGAVNGYATARALKKPYLRSLITSNKTPVVYPFEKDAPAESSPLEKESYTVGYGHNPMNQFVPDTIGANQPVIDVPQFNTALWRDAHQGMINPYGPYGMHTPPPIAAAATGLTSGLSAGIGSPVIRPTDLIRGFASAGVGLATANIAGRTLGALAGLTPEAQRRLQDMGLWGGMLSAVVPPMFAGRRF